MNPELARIIASLCGAATSMAVFGLAMHLRFRNRK